MVRLRKAARYWDLIHTRLEDTMKLIANYDEAAIKALIIAELAAKGFSTTPEKITVQTAVHGQYEDQEFEFKGYAAEVEKVA